MVEVFSEEVKNAFLIAKRLELSGEEELSRKLCVKCAMGAAKHNGIDMLELFYGSGIYDKIRNVVDAMNAVFVAHCAADAYDVIYPKNPIYRSINAWAIVKKGMPSNALLLEFFTWLAKHNRVPNDSDCKYFGKAIEALNEPGKTVYFNVDNRLSTCSLIDIIHMLVEGAIEINGRGELR